MREVTLYANRNNSLEGITGGEYLDIYDEYVAQIAFLLGIPRFGLLARRRDGRYDARSITPFILCS